MSNNASNKQGFLDNMKSRNTQGLIQTKMTMVLTFKFMVRGDGAVGESVPLACGSFGARIDISKSLKQVLTAPFLNARQHL